MESACLLSSAYLAPVQYYCKLFAFEEVIIEQHCHYLKQTYRNRCVIAAANGQMTLSIPIEKTTDKKQKTKDIRIASHGNWQHLHWNAIISAYNSSPFFEYYQDDFLPFYTKNYTFLFDLNEELRILISDLLQIENNNVSYSDSYIQHSEDNKYDFREIIHPKKGYALDNMFAPITYYQVFESRFGFLPNLSIIDLLFNKGPESLLILKNSIL